MNSSISPDIAENVHRILSELPIGVHLLAAAKTREPAEVMEAVKAGANIVGENYVQEAERARALVGNLAEWHFIGYLQKNKVKKAVAVFDVIETVDSIELAQEIDRRCAQAGKLLPVLIEVNSGREPQKYGVLPENVAGLAREIAHLGHIQVKGLMTMGPQSGHAEESRPYFKETRKVFDAIRKLGIPDVEMRYLSMGMTDSYRVAIEEGANIVRIGSKIFGERAY
jgi:pyridoxal phosphate enzyme (YggS family)